MDSNTNPCIITGISKRENEHNSILNIFSQNPVKICLYNELDMPIAWSEYIFNKSACVNIVNLLAEKDLFYTGPFNNLCKVILDKFDNTISNFISSTKSPLRDEFYIDLELSNWNIFTHILLKDNEIIEPPNEAKLEGDFLEKLVYFAFLRIFDNVFRNPQVHINGIARELTDVFTFYDWGYFLIESKALSTTQDNYNRAMSKKISGVKKQILKAIKQLQGALRTIQKGEKITDKNGSEITFDRTVIPHCIIIVSELFSGDEFDSIVVEIAKSFIKTRAYFHVLDLSEFLTLIKGSCLATVKKERFECNLLKRFEMFSEIKSINIRTKIHAGNLKS